MLCSIMIASQGLSDHGNFLTPIAFWIELILLCLFFCNFDWSSFKTTSWIVWTCVWKIGNESMKWIMWKKDIWLVSDVHLGFLAFSLTSSSLLLHSSFSVESNYQVKHWKNSELHSTMRSEPQKEQSDNSKNIVDQWWHCPSTLWLLSELSWQTNWLAQFASFLLLEFYNMMAWMP